jgi:hypothetical protein
VKTHRHLYLGIPVFFLQRGHASLGDLVFEFTNIEQRKSWIQRWIDWVGSVARRIYARVLG